MSRPLVCRTSEGMWAVLYSFGGSKVQVFTAWASALAFANHMAPIKVSYSSTGSWLPERRDGSDS